MLTNAFLRICFTMALVVKDCMGTATNAHQVDVLFLADFSQIHSNMDNFHKQFQVMMMRTGAVTNDEVMSIIVNETQYKNIIVHVYLTNDAAVSKLQAAVMGRHLSMYVEGVGYIGVLPGNSPHTTPKPVTTPAPVKNTTNAPIMTTTPEVTTTAKSTEHPSIKGYVWLNEYSADNEDITDCSATDEWSTIVVSRMPVGCHRFQHTRTHQDEYNFVNLENGHASQFGMICDAMCSSCISQVENLTYSDCIGTWGGSVSMYPAGPYCVGGAADGMNEIDENAVTINRYSTQGCDLDTNAATVLYTRNYPPVVMESELTCVADGTTDKFYALSKVSDDQGDVFFNGLLDCTDSDCKENCITVNLWQEGSCQRDSATGNGIQIANTRDTLETCASSFLSGTESEENGPQTVHIVSTNAADNMMVNTESIDSFAPQKITENGLESISKHDESSVQKENSSNLSPVAKALGISNSANKKLILSEVSKSGSEPGFSGATTPGSEILSDVGAPVSSAEQSDKETPTQMKGDSTLLVANTITNHNVKRPVANSMVSEAIEETPAGENTKMRNVLIAAGCVMGIAFVTIGIIYRHKIANRNYGPGSQAIDDDDDDDDDLYMEYDYECYNQYDLLVDRDRYQDERLVTII